MDTELIKQLLEAGSHFGHNRSRWNPKMGRYIFGERSKIYIIDLEKTVDCINKAREFAKKVASKGKSILFVGTKRQAQDIILEAAESSGMFFVKDRWLGGTLTNFKTIRNSIKRLKDIERMREDGTFEAITKKERAILTKEEEKLRRNLQGVVDMKGMPGAVFVVDAKKEDIAVKEARKLGIPIIAIVDTNADPDIIDYPIPANDDAMRSIKLITNLITQSIVEGRKMREDTIEKESSKDDDAEDIRDKSDDASEDVDNSDLKEKEEKPKAVTKKPKGKDKNEER